MVAEEHVEIFELAFGLRLSGIVYDFWLKNWVLCLEKYAAPPPT
jgi:hypothetical protein